MFAPHTAKIDIRRDDPTGIDLKKAAEKVRKRNAEFAKHIVIKNLLKKKPTAKSRDRIMAEWETDERLKYLRPFLEYWNDWGRYYLGDHYSWSPKNRSQIGCIESILDKVKEREADLYIFIGCAFKAYENRKASVPVSYVLAYGMEWYDRYYDAVYTDRAHDDYMENQ